MSKFHPLVQKMLDNNHDDSLLIGVSPGSGYITKTAVEAGIDVFFALNAGLYRTSGVSSLASFLAYGNANDQTDLLLRNHILPNRKNVPIVAGMMPRDPMVSDDVRLERLKKLGVGGIVNWPATGLVDGVMKELMEADGYTHEAEIQMLKKAKELGFATFGFALNAEEVKSFTKAGVDGLIFNVGPTKAIENATEHKNQLKYATMRALEMWEARSNCDPSPICFIFGGSIIQPVDLEEILRVVPLHGFAGGSAFERIPVTEIVDSTIRRLKSTPRQNALQSLDKLPQRGNLIGSSPEMQNLYNLIDRSSAYDINIWIEGETGTGKELVANYIHANSPRKNLPFITMNCGAIPETLIESEFFGYEKGAFTGAMETRKGKFELANHGTLFLDEISELSAHGQSALLRVIQQGEILRIGGQKLIPVDVRILAATNQNINDLITNEQFRPDLYYRISTFPIRTPALREHVSDIKPLVIYFLEQLSVLLNRKILGVTQEFLQRLEKYSWPGNIRELEHLLTRAALLEDSSILEGKEVLKEVVLEEINSPQQSSKYTIVQEALQKTQNNKSEAAKLLGISRKTLYSWLKL